MKTTIIALLIMLTTLSLTAQEKCNFYCHNGTVVKAVNDNAINGHEAHGDTFLGTCETFTGVEGGACEVLSADDYDFSRPLPIGKKYIVINLIGQVIKEGKVDSNFIQEMPTKQVVFLKINGYKLYKFYKDE